MLSEKIVEMLKKLIAEKLDVDIDDVVPQAEFITDLGTESLAMVELIMSVEELFDNDIEISDEENEMIVTVQDIFDLVEKKIS
jgi:acyl carrier protein